jgi:hypothetical protein
MIAMDTAKRKYSTIQCIAAELQRVNKPELPSLSGFSILWTDSFGPIGRSWSGVATAKSDRDDFDTTAAKDNDGNSFFLNMNFVFYLLFYVSGAQDFPWFEMENPKKEWKTTHLFTKELLG